jgi:type III restriction enzyme
VTKLPDISQVVALVTETVVKKTIPIPKIVVLPKKQVTFTFDDFDLTDLATINQRPIGDELLIENLRTGARISLARSGAVQYELRPEDYIVAPPIERDEIAYDDHAELIYTIIFGGRRWCTA